MSLIMIESYDDGHRASKWTAVNGVAPSTSYGRTSRGFYLPYTYSCDRYLSATEKHTTIIVGLAVRPVTSMATSTYGMLFIYTQVDGSGIRLYPQADGSVKVYNHTTLLGTSATNLLQLNVWSFLELKVYRHDTAGTVEVKIDGTTVINLTGQDTKYGTGADFDRVMVNGGGGNHHVDDIYICNGAGTLNNDFLGDMRIYTIVPNGNGTYSQLLGSDADKVNNYQLVDETPNPSTSDYVGSATTGEKDTYAFADLPASGSIPGIYLHMYAGKDDVGNRSLKRLIRSSTGGEDYGSNRTLGLGWGWYGEILEQDPVKSTDWTETNINATEFGAEVST